MNEVYNSTAWEERRRRHRLAADRRLALGGATRATAAYWLVPAALALGAVAGWLVG